MLSVSVTSTYPLIVVVRVSYPSVNRTPSSHPLSSTTKSKCKTFYELTRLFFPSTVSYHPSKVCIVILSKSKILIQNEVPKIHITKNTYKYCKNIQNKCFLGYFSVVNIFYVHQFIIFTELSFFYNFGICTLQILKM